MQNRQAETNPLLQKELSREEKEVELKKAQDRMISATNKEMCLQSTGMTFTFLISSIIGAGSSAVSLYLLGLNPDALVIGGSTCVSACGLGSGLTFFGKKIYEHDRKQAMEEIDRLNTELKQPSSLSMEK